MSKRQLWTPPAQSHVTSLTLDIMTPLAMNPLPRYHSNISRVKIHHTDVCQHAQCQRVVNCSHRGACQSGHHVPSCESSRLKRRYKRSHLKTFLEVEMRTTTFATDFCQNCLHNLNPPSESADLQNKTMRDKARTKQNKFKCAAS